MSLNNFPTGFDRGDGVSNLPTQPQLSDGTPAPFGTPTPVDALKQANPGGSASQPPQEDKESPEIERAEQATIMHKLKMAWQDGVNLVTGIGRGTFLEDSSGNVTRVLSSRLVSKPYNQSEVTIVAESISFDSPPDEFQISPIDLGLDIIKNPRYSWALAPVSSDNSNTTTVGDTVVNFTAIKSSLIRIIQAYRDSPFFPSGDQVNGLIQNNIVNQLQNGTIDVQIPIAGYDPGVALDVPPRWDGVIDDLPPGNYAYAIVSVPVNLADPTDPLAIAIAAATEIITKLWRQEDTPYLTGYQVTLSQYFFAPQFLNPGGFIQSPVGIVPDYFLSPSQDGSDSIFGQMASINPQSYSDTGLADGSVNISWLRKSDEVEYQRTWFRVTSTWIGSPIGNWDFQIYSQNNRPQNANDYDTLI